MEIDSNEPSSEHVRRESQGEEIEVMEPIENNIAFAERLDTQAEAGEMIVMEHIQQPNVIH